MVSQPSMASAVSLAHRRRASTATGRVLLISSRRPTFSPALVLHGALFRLPPCSTRYYSQSNDASNSNRTSAWKLGEKLRSMFGLTTSKASRSQPDKSRLQQAITRHAASPQQSSASSSPSSGSTASKPPSPPPKLSKAARRRALQLSGSNAGPAKSGGAPSAPPSVIGRKTKFKAALVATAVGFDESVAKQVMKEEREKLKRTSSITRAQRNAARRRTAEAAKAEAQAKLLNQEHSDNLKEANRTVLEKVARETGEDKALRDWDRRATLREKWHGNDEVGASKAKGKGLPQPESWLQKLSAAAGQGQARDVGRPDSSASAHALWASEAPIGGGAGIGESASASWGTDALAPRSERDIGRPFPDGPKPEEVESERPRYGIPPHFAEALNKARQAAMGVPPAAPARARGGDFGRSSPWSGRNDRGPPHGVEPTTLHFGDEAMAPYRRVRQGDGASVRDGYLTTEELDRLQREDEETKWKVTRGGRMTAEDAPLQKVKPLREMDVPVLAHGLDRVLFNPGVYWLRDPRTGIFNFDPVLAKIPDVDLFDYAALPPYVTSSKDKELAELAMREGRKYCGSTSSLTGLLSQIYFLISAWRGPDLSGFSEPFSGMPSGFSFGATLPAAIMLRKASSSSSEAQAGGPTGTRYAIDADKSASDEPENSNYVLMQLGKAMEKMLTSETEDFQRYMRVRSHELTREERERKESYHYAMTDKLMMRSQLDCSDPRLPNATFDLKSRAVIAIRRDRANWVESSGYMIRKSTGLLESFEREMFDMLRSAYLKYYFQARIGHMDGIFVAYHSTAAMYGFEYMPVEVMAERLFGSTEMAEQAFRLSIRMLEQILDEATRLFPDRTLRITLETGQNGSDSSLNAFIEPQLDEGESGAGVEEAQSTIDGEKEEAATADSTSSQEEEKKPERSIALLQVDVDRYLDGGGEKGLVRGPVDFEALPGRQIDMKLEDEIERRRRSELPPVQLELEWSIDPRPDLSESDVRRMLEVTRSKQGALKDLILPNVSAINQREAERESLLAVNPAALARFREERETGVAPGMPRAPGQVGVPGSSTGTASGKESGKAAKGEAEPEEGKTKGAAAKVKDEGEGSWRKSGGYISRLRRLARLGAEDAARQAAETPVLFESRGPSSSSPSSPPPSSSSSSAKD